MSKKRKRQQIILSLSTVVVLTLIATLFYLIDENISDDTSYSDIKVIENKSSGFDELVAEDKQKVSNRYLESDDNYLSEIQDLHDALENDIGEMGERNTTLNKKIANKNRSNKNSDVNSSEIIEIEPIELHQNDNRPKLAIIVDDIAFSYQVKKLRELNLPITLSFFPADINHPQTSQFAKKELVPMVHFPLEAQRYKNEEIDTLHVGDSNKRIEIRVKQIVKQFPGLKYTNNHTGSKFTSNYTSMKRLLISLKRHHIQFIDSVTTSKSVVRRISKELGLRYIRRDIFLDNILDVRYIKGQLKKAIAIAKKRGYAIAIGHPHKATIEALSQIKPLLNGVRLVRIDEI